MKSGKFTTVINNWNWYEEQNSDLYQRVIVEYEYAETPLRVFVTNIYIEGESVHFNLDAYDRLLKEIYQFHEKPVDTLLET